MGWLKNLPILLPTVLAGGLAGAVFTWYINRPQMTTLAYTITTTAIVADPAARSAVPNLRIQVGDEEVRSLFTHTIEFTVPAGQYAQSADVAITFSPVRMFGMSAPPPSAVHLLSCVPNTNGVRCSMGPLSPRHPAAFKVTIATDRASGPKIETATRDVELVSLNDYARRGKFWTVSLGDLLASAVASVAAGLFLWWGWRGGGLVGRLMRGDHQPPRDR